MNKNCSSEEEVYMKKRILWSSNREWNKNSSTRDFYEDTLTLIQVDDGCFKIELKVSGTVVCLPLTNLDKYLI